MWKLWLDVNYFRTKGNPPDVPTLSITTLPGLERLSNLGLQYCTLTTHPGCDNGPLADLSGLTLPNLGECCVSAAGLAGLASLTALQYLALQRLVPTSWDVLHRLAIDITPVLGGHAGTAAFLAAVSQLQQLTFLQWDDNPNALHKHDWATTLQAYSALTASSMLQELHLNLPSTTPPVWAMPWQQAVFGVTLDLFNHIFPDGRYLPNLRIVCLCGGDVCEAAMLSCVVRACPALHDLSITDYPTPRSSSGAAKPALPATAHKAGIASLDAGCAQTDSPCTADAA
jgi:hypothetical protein